MSLKGSKGPSKILQDEHLDEANAQKVVSGILVPGEVVTDDISSAGVLVKKGSLLRISVSSTTYIAFGASTIGAVSNTTSPGLELQSGVYLVCATDDYIRASADADRLEIIEQ